MAMPGLTIFFQRPGEAGPESHGRAERPESEDDGGEAVDVKLWGGELYTSTSSDLR